MEKQEHDLLQLTRALLPVVQEAAEDIESKQIIPPHLMQALSDAGLFSVAVPRELGGPEVDPLVQFDVLELLATADASTAWVVLIISANPLLFGNSLHSHVWQAMYGDNINVRTAGTLMPGGKAVKTDGGYRVTGRFRYGSGSEHCEYLLSGCMIFEGDTLCTDDKGGPAIRWLIHKTSDCEIINGSWDTTGLRGSSSQDYVLDDLFIPEDWSFVIGESVYPLANSIYRFPTIAFCQLAAVTLGMARSSIDIIKEIALTKRRGPLLLRDDPALQLRLAEAEAATGSARAYVKAVSRDIIDTLAAGKELSRDQRATFRLACTHAVDCSTKAVDAMYKLAGGSAVYKPNQLDRNLRDIHTAGTHLRFSDLTYIDAGRMLLGLEAGDTLF
jgi:alkylation response protein AidB-like acyl-CoA dehydrogenase